MVVIALMQGLYIYPLTLMWYREYNRKDEAWWQVWPLYLGFLIANELEDILEGNIYSSSDNMSWSGLEKTTIPEV